MITFENTCVMNMKNAVMGARNPMNSWDRSDSVELPDGTFQFGPNDLDLAKRLIRSGSDHRKFLRQIFVSVNITAPLYHDKRMNDCLPPILFSAIFKLLKVLPDTELDAC